MEGKFYGCCSLQSGLLVLPDYDKENVKILSKDGNLKSVVKFNELVYDATNIDQNHVAVSCLKSKSIAIVDLTANKVSKVLPIYHQASGITHTCGNIIFCVENRGLLKLNIKNGNVDEIFKDENVTLHSHVALKNHRICYTSFNTSDEVTVLDSEYKIIFRFKEETLLKWPCGVTIDDNRNVLVLGYSSHNLVMISPEGTTSKQLLSLDDGLMGPTALDYDSKAKQLILVNFDGNVLKYSLM